MGWGIEAMVWCANWVAGLPGAVGRVPAIPTYAFVLMVVGGLWCALWGTRWRLLGLVPIVLGLILAPTGRRPDVLIGRGGSHRRGAHRGRAAVGAGGARRELRAGALAGARRRRPPARRGGEGAGLPLRSPRLHGARQGHAAGGRQLAGGAARRLRGGGDPGDQVPQTEGLRPAGAWSSTATLSPPAAPTPCASMPDASASRPWPTRGAIAPGHQGSECTDDDPPQPGDDDWPARRGAGR